ncbi:MAG: aminotransferase class V-fold PLP-dependent enzyme [Bacteroidales bacterium]|nr:aminotransferase class V-fold PLP-dependent enzyme [Bacteroidales bacterium]
MKVYLDNSATSWPKPPSVISAITGYLNDYGASPGRSGHSFAIKAAREIFETRELIAVLFNAPDSERVIFSANATHAINIALKGLLKQGDHVIISHMEHNSVYRPLKYLENKGLIELTVIPCNEKGETDTRLISGSIKANTRLVVMIHGSNASGTVMPVAGIGEICRLKNILFMVDAAQTAGFIPIDIQKDNIDILAFTGHKKLYGPPGIGGLCIKDNILIETLIHGGTGSKSEMADHPAFYPDRLEAGTLNTVGVLGLKAGVQFILGKGIGSIRNQQLQLTEYLVVQLNNIDGIRIYGPGLSNERLPLVSFNIGRIPPSDIAFILDRDFGIMSRAGIHCTPLAHQAMGSFPRGTVRLSLGCFNTQQEIDYVAEALKKIISEKNFNI